MRLPCHSLTRISHCLSGICATGDPTVSTMPSTISTSPDSRYWPPPIGPPRRSGLRAHVTAPSRTPASVRPVSVLAATSCRTRQLGHVSIRYWCALRLCRVASCALQPRWRIRQPGDVPAANTADSGGGGGGGGGGSGGGGPHDLSPRVGPVSSTQATRPRLSLMPTKRYGY